VNINILEKITRGCEAGVLFAHSRGAIGISRLQVSSNYFCSAIDSLLVRIQELISLKWWLQWVILVINLQTCCLGIWLARFMGLVLMIGALARG